VQAALLEFETFAAARIRAGGQRSDRITGNFVGALFTHDTSRALDPHLHMHCIVFNATFDAVENRWKALENHELLRARKFVENAYYHELAKDLLSFGYRIRNRSRGDFSLADLKDSTARRGYIRRADRPHDVTMREVLLREWEIVQTVREGVGACHPLVRQPRPAILELDKEQHQALDSLLSSTNLVSLFRGAAGTGKSFVLRELVEQIQQDGRPVVVLAPQRQQVVDMEAAGFPSPTTVTSFLHKRAVPRSGVIVVDEAGQIGGRQMLELLRLARQQQARVILSGDTRQHGPVEASDALAAIERHSGVKPVELHRIRRQDPRLGQDVDERTHIRQYRKAVEAAAAGRLVDAFERLDKMGVVVECPLGDQAERLAAEYLRLAEQNSSAVVVSQTWSEVHRVNARTREALKAKGLLGTQDSMVEALERLDLTNAQKRDTRFYPSDAVVVFNQKVRHAEPGAKGKPVGIVSAGVLVEVDGTFITVQNRLLDRINVCVPRELPLTSGDRLHLKANRKLASGQKAATNAQQWYLTISRGRRGIRIFTPDKEQLRENVSRPGHRPLALDLTPGLVFQSPRRLWDTLRRHLLRFGRQAADRLSRVKPLRCRFNSTTPHPQNGRLAGLVDKRAGRELVDASAPQGFGQYFYERFGRQEVIDYLNTAIYPDHNLS